MLWYYIINFITSLFTAAFDWLPKVSKLPAVLGVDIDTMLSQGVSTFHTLIHTVWVLGDLWAAVLYIFYYLAAKMVLKLFLGHRAPA